MLLNLKSVLSIGEAQLVQNFTAQGRPTVRGTAKQYAHVG